MEENKKLRERVKILKDFQVACRKKTGRALSQKKDPRIQLITVPKLRINAAKDTDMHAINQGPVDNPHVADYRDAMSKYPFALTREPWSNEEKENLLKGIKQQFQEMLMQNLFSTEDTNYNLDIMIVKIRDHEISPEEMRSFLPKVNWEQLASMYLTNRTGPECQSRWMNLEDPLINHESWSLSEDKKLLYTVQNRGLSNWIEIAESLGTNRTPFQCLSRFQRSLNASIIKNEWTPPEDEELRTAVAEYGDTNWQLVASTLEGRTGTQCSNRWNKSLNPMRKRIGKWAPDEDKRLKIAVKLFGGKNWNKIARFVPGRTQVQCRERWVNCLDPALNMNEWTPQEDLQLKYAIEEHGYCWSKVAACVPPRTDNQCRRRWSVLLPHEVPVLQRARKMKKAAFISNFVDREEERPALTVNDFIAPLLIESAPEKPKENQRSEPDHCEPESSSGAVVRIRSRRARKVTHTEKTLRLIDEDEDEDVHEDIKGNQSLKNKQKISSQEAELSDLNNREGTETFNGDNSEIKKKATKKRKRRGNKEHKEVGETLETETTATPPTTESLEVTGTGIENGLKNVSSEETGLSDVNNGEGTGAITGDNSEIKTKATRKQKRKQKPRGNKEQDEPSESLILDKKTRRPSSRANRGCRSDLGGARLATSLGLLDPNNGEKAGDNSQIKVKRKPRGNKEHKKTDETLEPVAILSKKTTRPRAKANRGHRLASVNITEQDAPIDDLNEAVLTTEKTVTEICSSSSPTAAPPPAITGIENATSVDKTPRKRKRKQGGNSCSGDRPKRSCIKIKNSFGEIGDDETLGSFFSKLKMGDSETIGSFFSKLKKRRLE
ncbi:hypothetical protein L2E82_10208 [Cichorium intybus]|uniref:Uncharacterized protein n=1 Tax=Cichorium intybus TaxID=13427 RepID=A0ACB9GBZ0_CICIN|nr:hypothetical protein L2E82_10208 [Cichorium intybus]